MMTSMTNSNSNRPTTIANTIPIIAPKLESSPPPSSLTVRVGVVVVVMLVILIVVDVGTTGVVVSCCVEVEEGVGLGVLLLGEGELVGIIVVVVGTTNDVITGVDDDVITGVDDDVIISSRE